MKKGKQLRMNVNLAMDKMNWKAKVDPKSLSIMMKTEVIHSTSPRRGHFTSMTIVQLKISIPLNHRKT
jgi:hypothetical protein